MFQPFLDRPPQVVELLPYLLARILLLRCRSRSRPQEHQQAKQPRGDRSMNPLHGRVSG